jgi:hypothetical protein
MHRQFRGYVEAMAMHKWPAPSQQATLDMMGREDVTDDDLLLMQRGDAAYQRLLGLLCDRLTAPWLLDVISPYSPPCLSSYRPAAMEIPSEVEAACVGLADVVAASPDFGALGSPPPMRDPNQMVRLVRTLHLDALGLENSIDPIDLRRTIPPQVMQYARAAVGIRVTVLASFQLSFQALCGDKSPDGTLTVDADVVFGWGGKSSNIAQRIHELRLQAEGGSIIKSETGTVIRADLPSGEETRRFYVYVARQSWHLAGKLGNTITISGPELDSNLRLV